MPAQALAVYELEARLLPIGWRCDGAVVGAPAAAGLLQPMKELPVTLLKLLPWLSACLPQLTAPHLFQFTTSQLHLSAYPALSLRPSGDTTRHRTTNYYQLPARPASTNAWRKPSLDLGPPRLQRPFWRPLCIRRYGPLPPVVLRCSSPSPSDLQGRHGWSARLRRAAVTPRSADIVSYCFRQTVQRDTRPHKSRHHTLTPGHANPLDRPRSQVIRHLSTCSEPYPRRRSTPPA